MDFMEITIWSRIIKLYEKIEKRIRVCFFSALICGLFAHIYIMTNHLYNYDELWHTPSGFGTGTEVGRWALSITVKIQKIFFVDAYTIPVINGMITIILYALTACIVVSIFNVNDEYLAALVGALITTFPALTCRMFYMFTTYYYAIGILMVALGTWVLIKKKHTIYWILFSIILFVYGMAIYQANFVSGVCILVGYLLQKFIREENELKKEICACVNYVLYLGICMVSFLAGSKIALAITGKQMESYENLDTMGQITIPQLIEGIVRCYKTFFKMPLKNVYGMNPNSIVKVSFLIGILVLVYCLLIVWSSRKQIGNKILITLIIAVLPLACNLIIIMAISSGTMYSIMVYEIVYMLIIPIAVLEAIRECGILQEKNKILLISKDCINLINAAILTLTVFTYIWFANGNYLALEYANNHDNAYYTALMTQIKSVPNYREDMRLAVVGKPKNDPTNADPTMISKTFNLGGKAASNVEAYSSWNIMTRVLGFTPDVRWSDEDEAYFKGLSEVKEMPCYPNEGAIKIIDDTVVVKFSND